MKPEVVGIGEGVEWKESGEERRRGEREKRRKYQIWGGGMSRG